MFTTHNHLGVAIVALLTVFTIAADFISAQTPTMFGAQEISHGIALADFNGDGHIDTAVSNYGLGRIYFNDGQGGMLYQSSFGHSTYFCYDIDAADFDNDGDMDLLVASNDGADLYTNNGQGVFNKTWTFVYFQTVARAFAIGDLDSNGYLDIVIAAPSGNKVYLNTAGNFTYAGELLTQDDDTTGLTLGDFDGDGDLDCVVANTAPPSYPPPMIIPSPCALYLNDGNGIFTFSANIVGGASNVHTADFDGDTDLDLIFGNEGSPSEIWLNNGAAVFTKLGDLGVGSSATGLALADVDKDGDIDAVLVNWVQNQIYLNDGTGNFTASTVLVGGGSWCWDVEIADLDGDGDLDYGIVSGGFSANPQQNVLFLSSTGGTGGSGSTGPVGYGGSGCTVGSGSFWVLALLPALLLIRRRRRTS